MEEKREDPSPSLSDTVCFSQLSSLLSTYTSALLTTRAPEFYRNKVNPYWPVWAPRQNKVPDGRGQFGRWCLEGLLRERKEKKREEEEEGRGACQQRQGEKEGERCQREAGGGVKK